MFNALRPVGGCPQQSIRAAGLRRASTEEAGCAGCVRASDPFYQWRDESCHQHEGAGVGANLQEVRRAGHRSAADLVPGSWVFVEVRERTHDIGSLWLGRCVAVADWSGACRKKVVLPAGRRWLKEHGVRWDAGDWMIAVQWYSESDDGEYFRDEPCSDIFNSSELRLAGFAASQRRGLRQVNTRPRRGDQAAHLAELEAEALGAERPGTGTTVGDRQASLAQGGDAHGRLGQGQLQPQQFPYQLLSWTN